MVEFNRKSLESLSQVRAIQTNRFQGIPSIRKRDVVNALLAGGLKI